MLHLKPTVAAAAFLAMIGIVSAPSANAILIGDIVTLESYEDRGILLDSATGVAGTDDLTVVQFFGDDFFTPTFGNSVVAFEYDTTFSGTTEYTTAFLALTDLDWGGTGVLVEAVLLGSDVAGIDQSNLTVLGDDTLLIALAGGLWRDGDVVKIGLRAKHVDAIPEPSAAIVFGVGMLIIGRHASRRRRA